MPNLFTLSPGVPVAEVAARHILAQTSNESRAQAIVFVPTRRAAVSMRQAFQVLLGEQTSLLPRIFPLADISDALLTLLGTKAVQMLEAIPPAMPRWQQHYVLAVQVRAFLSQSHPYVGVEYPLALAEDLIALEEECARAGVRLTPEKLRGLASGNSAAHWEQSLAFLNILAQEWPKLESALGMTSQVRRDTAMLEALTTHWRAHPPKEDIFVVGSTASQESTAQLLEVIANLPNGAVILPGIDPTVMAQEWQSIESGHPLFHLKQFLNRFPVTPSELSFLGAPSPTIWTQVLASASQMLHWREVTLKPYQHIRLIPCVHAESEARVISVLMREALETPDKRTALITPDEGLMARVAAHMRRYGVTIDRLDQGTLAQTAEGSLWMLLLATMREPERLLHLRSLLHHPRLEISRALLGLFEPYWYGVHPRHPGELPKLPESIRMHDEYPAVERFVRATASLTAAAIAPTVWVSEIKRLLSPWREELQSGDEAIEEILESFSDADLFGPVSIEEFSALIQQRFQEARRHGGVAAHPQLVMLTPVEARLEKFDRVILGSMTENLWPGLPKTNAWLNLAAQASIGIAPPTHHVSLVAHDVLMLGSCKEVFCTWPQRDGGSPTDRSRFIERLVALLAMHEVPEKAITATHYNEWADQLFAAQEFTPATPPEPKPVKEHRPTRLPVSSLDTLFSDPYSIYARYVLNLRALEEVDAEADASDFGSLAHKAIQALTNAWNETGATASQQNLAAMADKALQDFSNRASTALFWRTRLIRALEFVNQMEAQRRNNATLTVTTESSVEKELLLTASEKMTLHGRLDRLEKSSNGAVIADYKTGNIPTSKKMLEGSATQLLAYALLTTDVAALEYWQLPHAKQEGMIVRIEQEEWLQSAVLDRLKEGLMRMLDETTPFLAQPDRVRDYDGISRYDEWAG